MTVRPGSPAANAGLRPGDRLVAIDGMAPRDVLDVQDQTQGRSKATMDLIRDGVLRTVRVRLAGVDDLGIDFQEPTFDGLRQCNNNCEFCFIRGLPKGLRRSLYVRDDDYRYSFLYGSFVTLTNLGTDDWNRLAYQRLSPLRVSVHATDPDLRSRLLAHPGAPPILPQLRWLGRVGLKVHAQVVLCPGINDADVLNQTIADLASVEQAVESVAVVPVGISDHLPLREIRPVEMADAVETLNTVLNWNRRLRDQIGRGFVYPSDEFFLMTGRPVPGAKFYDGYPQLQNGVGLTRLMLTDWATWKRRLPDRLGRLTRMAWLCGPAARGALQGIAADAGRVGGLWVEVVPVESSLFGSAITVSGLMAGRDAAEALRGRDVDLALLPRSAFGHEGQRTLDEWTVEDLERETGTRIVLGASARDIVSAILDAAEDPQLG